LPIAHGDPDLILGKSSVFEPLNGSFCVDLVLKETDDGATISGGFGILVFTH
jgi:hypothetical protein